VGAFVGAFSVAPILVSSGFGAEIDDVSGFIFFSGAPDDPDGPTNVISSPTVRAPLPVNILLPLGYVVLSKL
jgi:hypothetical protein